MIVIEIDTTTILIAVISSIVSVVASGLITWYFSRRYYTRDLGPVTDKDIELQAGKHEFYLGLILFIFLIGGFFGFMALLVIMA